MQNVVWPDFKPLLPMLGFKSHLKTKIQLSFKLVIMSTRPLPRLCALAWQSLRIREVGLLPFNDAVQVQIHVCRFVQANFCTHRIPRRPTEHGPLLEQYMCMATGLPALWVLQTAHTLDSRCSGLAAITIANLVDPTTAVAMLFDEDMTVPKYYNITKSTDEQGILFRVIVLLSTISLSEIKLNSITECYILTYFFKRNHSSRES